MDRTRIIERAFRLVQVVSAYVARARQFFEAVLLVVEG